MFFYGLTVLVSSFLLFQIQPMIAKLILPWFGGSAAVWTTCMLFFQATLLLGYVYAHWSVTKLPVRAQVWLHTGLLAFCLFLLPVSPSEAWKPLAENPTLRIFALLAVTVGLPYFLLSTTGPLIQAWYTRARHGSAPYRLFALSNAGSAAGLLTYPVLVEPFLTARVQTTIWSGLFVVFAVCCASTAWLSRRRAPKPVPEKGEDGAGAIRPALRTAITWLLLAACASILLLSVTNFLTQDVAPAPFLWVLPLSLYLFTFIICFDADRWYRRGLFLALLPLALGAMAWYLWPGATLLPLWASIAVYAAGFFVCAMVCHGELARLKPHPRYLTGYFLVIATGGALGGVFVGVVAPYFFSGSFELHLGLALIAALTAFRLRVDPPIRPARCPLLASWAGALLTGCLFMFLVMVVRDYRADCRLIVRNFYGALRIRDRLAESVRYRTLVHGIINHGEQWLDPELQRDPVTYYCAETGVGQALTRKDAPRPSRVGIIGLGVGTLAAYSRPGDTYRFYELNPLIADIAKTWFTYVGDARGKIEIVLGDGRLSLERESAQNFDVLALDAFASDSIPVHLLTREAFQVYFRHLKRDGVLAVHTSNKYVDLPPLVESLAMSFGRTATVVQTKEDESRDCSATAWVLIAPRENNVTPAAAVRELTRMRPWTDDYSNLFSLLR